MPLKDCRFKTMEEMEEYYKREGQIKINIMAEKKQLELKGSMYNTEVATQGIALGKMMKKIITENGYYTVIGKTNYVNVEGWTIAGAFAGLNCIIEEVKDLSNDKEIKWSAKAVIYNRKGQAVGIGYAVCSNKEAKKKSFDEYAVLSMAQTRAIGKAYRNKIGWIMKLAGYATTPAEEMVNAEVAKEERAGGVDGVIKTIASMKTLDNLEHLKSNLNAKKKDFTKEEQNLIRKALNEKETELSVSST